MIATYDLIEAGNKLGVQLDTNHDGVVLQAEGLKALLEAYQDNKISGDDFRIMLENLGISMDATETKVKSGKEVFSELSREFYGVGEASKGLARDMSESSVRSQVVLEQWGLAFNGMSVMATNAMLFLYEEGIQNVGYATLVIFNSIGEGIGFLGKTILEKTAYIVDVFKNGMRSMVDVSNSALQSLTERFWGAFNSIAKAAQDLWDKMTGHSIWTDMLAEMGSQTDSMLPRIEGRFDQLSNNITGSVASIPAGGMNGGGGNTIVIQGPIYGFDDFRRRVNEAVSGDVRTRVVF